MPDITGNRQHGIIRPVLRGHVIEHHVPVDSRHRFLAAGDIPPQGMPRPEQLIDEHGHPLRRRVQRHVNLFDDDLALLFNLRGVEERVGEYIHHHVQGAVEMRLRHLAPVDGQLFIGAGVKHTPHPFDHRTDIHGRRPFFRALKTHVLDKVGDTRLLIRLVP